VLVGINLLREGLDLPEVSLVAILDADKEGYLRSHDFADPDHGAVRAAHFRESDSVCGPANEIHERGDRAKRTGDARSRWSTTRKTNITPQSIVKGVDMELGVHRGGGLRDGAAGLPGNWTRPRRTFARRHNSPKFWEKLEAQMREAAKKFEFEKAAQLRDRYGR